MATPADIQAWAEKTWHDRQTTWIVAIVTWRDALELVKGANREYLNRTRARATRAEHAVERAAKRLMK